MFERFDDSARAVLRRAEQLARYREASGVGVADLVAAAREQLGLIDLRSFPSPGGTTARALPFDDDVLEMLSDAYRHAVTSGTAAVDTRQLLDVMLASGHPHAQVPHAQASRTQVPDEPPTGDATVEQPPPVTARSSTASSDEAADDRSPASGPVETRDREARRQPRATLTNINATPSLVIGSILALLTAFSAALVSVDTFTSHREPVGPDEELPEPQPSPADEEAPPLREGSATVEEPPDAAPDEKTSTSLLTASSPAAVAATSTPTSRSGSAAPGTVRTSTTTTSQILETTSEEHDDVECTGRGGRTGRGHDKIHGHHRGHHRHGSHCTGIETGDRG